MKKIETKIIKTNPVYQKDIIIMKKVSIIIACYNHARFLEKAVNSPSLVGVDGLPVEVKKLPSK